MVNNFFVLKHTHASFLGKTISSHLSIQIEKPDLSNIVINRDILVFIFCHTSVVCWKFSKTA